MLPARSVSTMSAEHLAYNISEACQVTRAGRTAVYEAIRSGELRAVKRGRRTLILADDLRRWLENLPTVAPKAKVVTITTAAYPPGKKAQRGPGSRIYRQVASHNAADDDGEALP